MNAKTTIFLLILVAGLGGYFAFVELGRETTRDREAAAGGADPSAGEPLFADRGFAVDDVVSVTIARDDGAVAFERDTGDGDASPAAAWWQTEPVRFPLRSFPVEDLVSAAVRLRAFESFVPGEDGNPTAAELGLDADATAVALTTADGETFRVRLGRRGARDRAYLALDGEGGVAHAVSPSLHRQAARPASEFRLNRTEPQGFDLPGQADRVALTRGGETIELTRREGRWVLDARGTQRADPEAADALAAAAGSLPIDGFVADAPGSLSLYGLDAPRLEVTVTAELPPAARGDAAPAGDPGAGDSGAGVTRTHTVRVGSAADLDRTKFFAAWSIDGAEPGVVFTVRDTSLEDLRVERDALRDPAVVLSDPAALTRVALERAGEPTLAVRFDGERWAFDASMGTDDRAGFGPVADWLTALTALTAGAFAPPPPADAAPAMTLGLSAGGEAETVRVYEIGGALHAVRNDETIAHVLDDEAVEPLRIDRLALVDRTLLELDPGTLASIELVQSDGVSLAFKRAPADAESAGGEAAPAGVAWSLDGFDTFEDAAFDELLDALALLAVESWNDASVVLGGEGVIELRLVPVDGEPMTLSVAPGSGRGVASFSSHAFTLGDAVVEALDAEYRERTVIPPDAGEVVGVSVVRPDGTARSAIDLGEGVEAEGGDVDLAAFATIRERLAGLEAERWLDAAAGEAIAAAASGVTTMAVQTSRDRSFVLRLAEPLTETRAVEVAGRGWFRLSVSAAADLSAAFVVPADGGEAEGG